MEGDDLRHNLETKPISASGSVTAEDFNVIPPPPNCVYRKPDELKKWHCVGIWIDILITTRKT